MHAPHDTFERVDRLLRAKGVDVAEFGFYDQPAFRAIELTDPLALEQFSAWVLTRPREHAYDRHVRTVVPKLASIIESRIAASQSLGACANVAAMMARMLDRLGVWSFAARGSLTIEVPHRPDIGRRYFPECTRTDSPDEVTGHGWLVAPPYLVVDCTLRHQRWHGLHPAIETALPKCVAAETAEIVRPRWFDILGDDAVAFHRLSQRDLTDDLPYRFHPHLARVERSLPGRDIRIGDLSLRYFASTVTLSELPLELLPELSMVGSELKPIDIWTDHVAPAFA